jgi:predicted LPLAT superfamily acyltransferase
VTNEWVRTQERGSIAVLRFLAFLSLRLGRTLSRAVLYCCVCYFFLFARRSISPSRRYLRLALGRPPTAADRFRQMLYFGTCVHDRIYFLRDQYARFEITMQGEALVRDQLASGDGAFLIGAHLGSFELMRCVGERQPGVRVAMAMYEANARKANAVLSAVTVSAKPDIISLGQVDAMLRIRERLDEGVFVGVLADRTFGEGMTQPVSLLGEPALLPTGPMRVAAILRRRVIFMVGLYRGCNRYHVVFAPVADFSQVPAGARDEAVSEAIDRYAALVEQCCRSDPYNWFNFFDVWQGGNADASAGADSNAGAGVGARP